MKRLIFVLLLLCASALADQRFNGKCTSAGVVITSGLTSTNAADLTYASATVTVSITGGGLATIFTDSGEIVELANPFTANSDATFFFYAPNGRYDITCTGSGVPTISILDNLLDDPTVALATSNIIIPEGSCTGPTPGFDIICASSSLHSIQTSLNGAGFVAIPQLAGDLAGTTASPQVRSTHLTSPLPAAQGGTGVAQSQGTGPKNQLAAGTTTTGDFISYDSNGNAIDSGKAAPTGAVVGTTDTQTLSNKTLSSPNSTGVDNGVESLNNKSLTDGASGNKVTLLDHQGPAAQLTGTGAPVVIYTTTLGAGKIGAGKCILITYGFNHTQGSAAVAYVISFGASAIASFSITDTAIAQELVEYKYCNDPGVTNSQHGTIKAFENTGAATVISNTGSSAIDTTMTQVLQITFTVAATDKVTPEMEVIEAIQ